MHIWLYGVFIMLGAPSSQFIDDLLVIASEIEGNPAKEARWLALREQKSKAVGDRARQLLANAKPITKTLSFWREDDGAKLSHEIRELVLPYKSEYGECELVLSDSYYGDPKKQPNFAVLEVRQPGQSASTEYRPGAVLFMFFDGKDLNDQPMTDIVTADNLLSLFE